MSSDWTEVVSRRNRSSSRLSYPYVPPPLRDSGLTGYSNGPPERFATESYSPGYRFNNNPSQDRGRGRRRGGRGRGRDQWRGHQFQNPEPNPFDIADKFDELEVTEDTCGEMGIDFDAYENIPVQSSGDDIPPPVNTFADIDLGKALNDNIRRCKFVKPTPIQRHAIPIVVAGRDLMACAQTGSGKTAAFCFPIISGILRKKETMRASMFMSHAGGARVASPIALILSPTRELSCQIHDEAKKFAHQTGVNIVVAYGGAPISQQLRNLERGVDILVATPGRLVDMIERERVSLSKIKYLTLDEADRMLDMGFEPQIRKIVEQLDMPRTGARQTMLFSATFPDEIQSLASDFLSNYIFLSVGRVGSSTERIAQRVEYVEDMDKRNKLLNILHVQKENGTHGKRALMLVFVGTKRGADALEHWLFGNGFPATAIHGDKVQMERESALRSFKIGATPIMVATDVAARGLDISNVSHVINFDLPKSIDDYVHRIGRTGRAGKSGIATAFFNEGNASLAKPLVELMQEVKQEVPDWLSQYAEKSSSYSGGSGRGGTYGGYDYRNDYNSSPYTGTFSDDPVEGGSDYAACNVDSYGTGSFGYATDVGSVEATGWD